MGKATGFLQYQRQPLPERPPHERLADWQHLHEPLPVPVLQTQAARCMDCGIPFCHTGAIINGMTSGCPVNNLIPEWNDLVYRGLWREAYERLAKTNNFPEFTGLVCPAPCEASCTLGIQDPPVTIKNIEYAIIERAFEEGWVQPHQPARSTGKRVAIIGSGPAGLACADQLVRVGHDVTVFERDDRPGGLLMYGIPNMKLDKTIVQRRLDLMARMGVTFETGVEVGVDVSKQSHRTALDPQELLATYDALVLCTGATQPRALPVEGQALHGIHFAVDFLRANTKRLLANGNRRLLGSFLQKLLLALRHGHGHQGFISARDKDVIVIGGGDTGTDCVATALRHGCRSLVQFEILPRPPAERAPDNPWPQWPRIHTMDYGHKEAAAVFGGDPRRYCITTTRFLSDDNGRLTGVQTREVAWEQEANGHHTFREVPGTARVWPAQLVLLAMGFLGPEASLLQRLGCEQDDRSNVKAQFGDYITNVPGVFAAGDARRGQSLVVWAIREGRGAAREVDAYLMGETNLP